MGAGEGGDAAVVQSSRRSPVHSRSAVSNIVGDYDIAGAASDYGAFDIHHRNIEGAGSHQPGIVCGGIGDGGRSDGEDRTWSMGAGEGGDAAVVQSSRRSPVHGRPAVSNIVGDYDIAGAASDHGVFSIHHRDIEGTGGRQAGIVRGGVGDGGRTDGEDRPWNVGAGEGGDAAVVHGSRGRPVDSRSANARAGKCGNVHRAIGNGGQFIVHDCDGKRAVQSYDHRIQKNLHLKGIHRCSHWKGGPAGQASCLRQRYNNNARAWVNNSDRIIDDSRANSRLGIHHDVCRAKNAACQAFTRC